MFGFFKKKTTPENHQPENEVSHPQTENNEAAKLIPENHSFEKFTLDDFHLLMKAYFRSGNFAALCIAKGFGLEGDNLNSENNAQFFKALLENTPDEMDQEGRKACFRRFESEVLRVLGSNIMELSFGFQDTRRKPDMSASEIERIAEIAKPVQSKVVANLSELFSADNLEEEVFNYILLVRKDDLEMIYSELIKRKDYVRKTFGALRNTRVNKYGDEDYDAELDEMAQFIEYAFDKNDFRFFYTIKPLAALLSIVDDMLDANRTVGEIPMDGIEFEHWCADRLREQGWDVSVSKASGDQGIDVLAKRETVEVAIQCKRYTNPIGNKAVQEAFTGAQNEGAGHSCVIGTGGFTASARQISEKTGVYLLDANEIASFSSYFGFESQLDVNAAQSDEEVGADSPSILFTLSGAAEGFIGTMMRSFLKNHELSQLELDLAVKQLVLSSLDKDTGEGCFRCDREVAVRLIIFAAISMKTEITLTPANLQATLESAHFEHDVVQLFANKAVEVEALLIEDLRPEVYEALFRKADEMGPMYSSFLNEQLNEILVE